MCQHPRLRVHDMFSAILSELLKLNTIPVPRTHKFDTAGCSFGVTCGSVRLSTEVAETNKGF